MRGGWVWTGVLAVLLPTVAGGGRAAAMGSPEYLALGYFILRMANVGAPSWSPDGESMAFVVGSPAWEATIATVGVSGANRRELCPGTEPKWSPRGDWIAFFEAERAGGYALSVVSPEGGEPRRLAGGCASTASVWSQDGQYLAFERVESREVETGAASGRPVSVGNVYIVEVRTGSVRRVTDLESVCLADARSVTIRVAGWTAEGEVVFVLRVRGAPGSGLYAVEVGAGELRRVFAGEFYLVSLSPDGTEVVLTGHPGAASGEPTVAPQTELMLGRVGEEAVRRVVLTPWGEEVRNISAGWGRRVVMESGPGAGDTYVLTRVELDSGRREVLTEAGVMEGAPAVSPDGSMAAYYREAREDSSEVVATDLYVMGMEGEAARFVAHCYHDAAPGK